MLATLRHLGLGLLWTLAIVPVALWLLHLQSPTAAVATHLWVAQALRTSALAGAVTLAVGLLLFPPLPAGLRLLLASTRKLATGDRSRLARAHADLQQLETAQRHLDYGRLAAQAGQPGVAVQHLRRAVELDAGAIAPRYEIGELLHDQRAYAQALPWLLDVVQRDPGHAFGEALLRLARVTFLCGDHRAALALLQQHERAHGGNRRSQYWLAQALDAVGDRTAARAVLTQAAAPPPPRQRLTAEENWYRAWARVALWRHGGAP